MDAATRKLVRVRAGFRCEYCRLHEDERDFHSFHIEHIIAKQHAGGDGDDNLCLSCADCNWAKGTNLAGRIGERLVPLFHPRRQSWKRHFQWNNTLLLGKTLVGQVTIQVLRINDDVRVMLRENLLFEGRFPPDA